MFVYSELHVLNSCYTFTPIKISQLQLDRLQHSKSPFKVHREVKARGL